MRKFTPEEEAILRGELPVTVDYRALWTPQPGRSSPEDGTGWIWLGTTPNDLIPTGEAIAERLDAPLPCYHSAQRLVRVSSTGRVPERPPAGSRGRAFTAKAGS